MSVSVAEEEQPQKENNSNKNSTSSPETPQETKETKENNNEHNLEKEQEEEEEEAENKMTLNKNENESENNAENENENEERELLPDPELVIKHPLQNSWTLWFFKPDRKRNWEDNQKPIITFNTVEDFWGLYNHIELASKLGPGCDYSLFKEGIKPMWEDERNSKGGRWVINLDKKQRTQYLDTFWLEVMLCLIGESFDDHSVYVNGAVVSIRPKGDKIGMWLGDASQGDSIITVGKKVKERLGIDKVTLGFEAHQDTMKKSGSTAKHRFTV